MFTYGNIEPFWNDFYKHLDYTRESFNNSSDVDLWVKQGYVSKFFTGEMYIAKKSENLLTSKFFNLFPGKHTGVTFYKMETSVVMPRHTDTFKFFIEKNIIVDPTKIKRSLIFLEDWKSGHIFEIENTPITNWKAGDYFTWDISSPHLAANIGLDYRYTVQITYYDV